MPGIHTISLPPDTQHLAALRSFINAAAVNDGVNPASLRALELAADEIATNVIKHAGSNGDIFCSYSIDTEHHTAICEISWQSAEPFFPNVLPGSEDIRQRLEARQPGGLGLFLIHSLIDKIEYDYRDGKTVIKLMKDL
jgi:serine/threonine-protein kinase RsbW